MTESPESSTAWHDEGTRSAWARYRRNAWLLAVASLVPVVVATTILDVSGRPLRELEASGDRVPGVVTERSRGARTGGSVRFQFEYRGELRSGKVNLTSFGTQYRTGDPVTVLVDPRNPTNLTLEGERNVSRVVEALTGMVMFTAGLLLVTGLGGALRARRQRRQLRRAPWRTVEALVRVRRSFGEPRVLIELRLPGDRTVLVGLVRSLQSAPEESRRPQRVDVVGGGRGYWVVRMSPARPLLSAREPFTPWGRRRWARRR